MPDSRAALLLSRHDTTTRRLLERLAALAPDPHRRRELGEVRARVLEHLADGELLADDADIDAHARRWMRRALHDATDDGLLSVVAAICRELAQVASAPAARTMRAA